MKAGNSLLVVGTYMNDKGQSYFDQVITLKEPETATMIADLREHFAKVYEVESKQIVFLNIINLDNL